jgi:hypothetical protein
MMETFGSLTSTRPRTRTAESDIAIRVHARIPGPIGSPATSECSCHAEECTNPANVMPPCDSRREPLCSGTHRRIGVETREP